METARGVDEAVALIGCRESKPRGDVTGDAVKSVMKLKQVKRESRRELNEAILKVKESVDSMSTSALV